LEFLQNALSEQLEDIPLAIQLMYFQHDGTLHHKVNVPMTGRLSVYHYK